MKDSFTQSRKERMSRKVSLRLGAFFAPSRETVLH